MPNTIMDNIKRFREDEGYLAAITKLEKWRDALEEMAELESGEDLKSILHILSLVHAAIRDTVRWGEKHPPKDVISGRGTID